MQGKISVRSIQEMLARLNESQEPLFYVGWMYCNIKLHVHDFMPKYEIITCYDPFHGKYPFVQVPASIRNSPVPHRCEQIDTCLLALLRDPEVIGYMRSKGKHPKACLTSSSEQCQRICRDNGIQVWGPSSETFDYLGNKVKIVEVLKEANIPFIPNILSALDSYEQLLEISKCWNGTLVIQAQEGASGCGTFFINSQEDYQRHEKQIADGQLKKIMPFRRLRSFGIGGVTGSFGTALGPIHSQLIGHEKLTPFLAGFCGNQIRKDYFQDPEMQKKIRKDIYTCAERFGDHIYKKGIYRGHFGLDFVVDMDSFEVFLMEVNPRQTADATLSYQYYQADGHKFPLFLYSCAEWLGYELKFDVRQYNRQWQERVELYEPSGFHIAFKYMNSKELDIDTKAPMGIWILQQDQLKFTGRFTFLISQLKQDEFFFLPSKGFAKGHLFLRRNCQQPNGKLDPFTESLVQKFLSLIHSPSQP